MRLRIATFNLENLASRHAVGPKARPGTAPALSLFDFADPGTRGSAQASVAVALEDDARVLTALALAETRADILALQEVDNLGVLAPFVSNYLHPLTDIRYGHLRLVGGNDPRGIDVAFAARQGLVAGEESVRVRSYHEATFADLAVPIDGLEAFRIGPQDRVFNRDCLEVALDLGTADLCLFICHFKSIGYGDEGRERTRPLRRAEALGVRRIVERRFGAGWRDANWMVLGDLNDFRTRILPGGHAQAMAPSGIDPLLDDFAVDALAGLDPLARWTSFVHEGDRETGLCEQHVQLDHVLLSPALAAANPTPGVEIVRRGLPYRVPLDPAHPDRSIGYLATRADRYPRVGWERPHASDHCPVVVEIDVPGCRR